MTATIVRPARDLLRRRERQPETTEQGTSVKRRKVPRCGPLFWRRRFSARAEDIENARRVHPGASS